MLLMGIDIGTSGAKCLAVNASGQVIAKSTHEYPLETPRPGWAEQNPEHRRYPVIRSPASLSPVRCMALSRSTIPVR